MERNIPSLTSNPLPLKCGFFVLNLCIFCLYLCISTQFSPIFVQVTCKVFTCMLHVWYTLSSGLLRDSTSKKVTCGCLWGCR